jgi:hypothetical protein
MASLLLSSVNRSESSDSIPDVAFIAKDSILTSDVPEGPSDHKLKEMNGELAPEPLLLADKSRFVLFPIKHNDVSVLSNLNFLNFFLNILNADMGDVQEGRSLILDSRRNRSCD